MKNLLLALVCFSALCATPALAAETGSTPPAGAATVSPTPTAGVPIVSEPAAPSLPALPPDLFSPAPTERGYMGPCTITVNCPCPCGIEPVSCSGATYCVGGGGVSCDFGPWQYCTTACKRCDA